MPTTNSAVTQNTAGKMSTQMIILIVIGALLFLCCSCGVLFAMLPTSETSTTNDAITTEPTSIATETTQEVTATDMPAPTSAITPTPSMTVSQKNALAKAKSYLEFSAFSHDGLVAQLEFEQFSHADAVYAADNCGADWNEQAAKKAESYMSYSAFSRGGLIDQLKFEKFTQEQAEYGATSVGL